MSPREGEKDDGGPRHRHENDDERHADADRRIIHKFEKFTAKHQGLLDDAAPRIDQGDN
jgi:hypothetical protein